MKIKTAELVGPALDWAVGVIEIPKDVRDSRLRHWPHPNNPKLICRIEYNYNSHPEGWSLYSPSTDWSIAGSIIEREFITLRTNACVLGHWVAFIDFGSSNCNIKARQTGSTPLIAAMRCYVASKLGNEVDIPDELV